MKSTICHKVLVVSCLFLWLFNPPGCVSAIWDKSCKTRISRNLTSTHWRLLSYQSVLFFNKCGSGLFECTSDILVGWCGDSDRLIRVFILQFWSALSWRNLGHPHRKGTFQSTLRFERRVPFKGFYKSYVSALPSGAGLALCHLCHGQLAEGSAAFGDLNTPERFWVFLGPPEN